jgi:acid stress-induced BolA-like protein IbaG/YrbA
LTTAFPTALNPSIPPRHHDPYCDMRAQQLERLIEENLPGAEAMVRGDDGVHFEAVVVSDEFAGKSLIQQHRLVYAALGGRMEREEIHALSLKTYTPGAWRTLQTRSADPIA